MKIWKDTLFVGGLVFLSLVVTTMIIVIEGMELK